MKISRPDRMPVKPAAVLACLLAFTAPATAVEIAPHRAVYKMSLTSVRSSANVADVQGKMLFEWADACDGWTIDQRFQLDFAYAEGDRVAMTTNYVTWEAKDGSAYRFNVRKLVNGQLDEELRGEAEMGAEGGVARYAKPKEAEVRLPAGTMFPTLHTIAMLRHAMAGDKVFGTMVFDGSDEEGLTEINAAVGLGVQGQAPPEGVEPSDLLQGRHWPVRLAFFPPSSTAAAPEYEMSMDLLENGVARSMQIDYGDFTVSAKLEKVERIGKPGC
ncbi:cell envelope integrity EipB family protein [Arenibaculum pallidiluteum]|uniref:cell envelope integrity EipB family protein n=1 Tax=Arenibaculum pallidiluteum TaxID=2812559 RepID=UPI002E2BE76D|nr:cell envelope integrity EipB family protein [Arenibaculum pallidiluteum]